MTNPDPAHLTPRATRRKGPGTHHVGPIGIVLSATSLVGLACVALYVLLKVWPHPTPSTARPETDLAVEEPAVEDSLATDVAEESAPERVSYLACTPPEAGAEARYIPIPDTTPGVGCVKLFNRHIPLWDEQRLLVLVVLAGVIGALVHALRSIAWYVGSGTLIWRWLLLYMTLPFVGALMAVIFYVVVRGGFFASNTTIEDTSPFAFVAVALIVGMFSREAALTLKRLAGNVFTVAGAGPDPAPRDDPGAEAGTKPVVTDARYEKRTAGGRDEHLLVVTGTGFHSRATASVNGQERRVVYKSPTELELPLEESDVEVLKRGELEFMIVNPGSQGSDLFPVT